MLERILAEYIYDSTGSIAIREDFMVTMKLSYALSRINSQCLLDMKEAIGENGNIDAYSLLHNGNLFVAYPHEGIGSSRLARMICGGYRTLQGNMGIEKGMSIIFLQRKVPIEETYATHGLLKLSFDRESIDQLWDALFSLAHSLLASKHSADDAVWVCARARAIKRPRVLCQVETLARAYLGVEVISAIGISPYLAHLLRVEYTDLIYLCRSKQNMANFCTASCTIVIEDKYKTSAHLLGSFFHFLSEKMDMGYYEYFLHLLDIFRGGAVTFREVVMQSTFIKWDALGDEWSLNIYEEMCRIISHPSIPPIPPAVLRLV